MASTQREVETVEIGDTQHQRHLGSDRADRAHPVAVDQLEDRLGTPLGEQVGRPAGGEEPRQLGHDADVGELGAGVAVAAAAPGAAGVEVGDDPELPAGVPRSLGGAGAARREADAHRAIGIVHELGDGTAVSSQTGEDAVGVIGEHDRFDVEAIGHAVEVGVVGEHQVGLEHLECRPALRPPEPGIETCGHGTDLRCGQVGDDVVGGARKAQRDDRTGPEAAGGQAGGDLVGEPIEIGVGDDPTFGRDVRRSVCVVGGGTADHTVRARVQSVPAAPGHAGSAAAVAGTIRPCSRRSGSPGGAASPSPR